MGKGTFHVDMPNDEQIESEIRQIVAAGVKPKPSFFTELKTVYRQVGLRRLISDHSEHVLLLLAVVSVLSFLSIQMTGTEVQVQDLYRFIFFVSPLLYLLVSFYTVFHKVQNRTYEVEMTCQHNVYQIIAFRMLVFSIVSISVNTVSIGLLNVVYENLQFIRAWMISTTALFVFSVLFLYVMMKKRSATMTYAVIAVWVGGNGCLLVFDHALTYLLLVNLPLFVYAIVMVTCLVIYLNKLRHLMHLNPMEGVL